MNRFQLSMALATGLLVIAACQPAQPAQPAAPPPAQPAEPAAQPAQPAAWEQEWEETLEAARQEGRVVMFGPTGADVRVAMTEPFEARYGISVEYTSLRGAEIPSRVAAEREANQYLWDLYVAGSTTIHTGLKPIGVLDPIEPLLILPEVTDPSNWRYGGLDFDDPEGMILRHSLFHGGTIFINTDLVNPEEITSYRDLLDPKWRGQIISDDPRISGPGQATFTFFYLHPDLGPDFIRELAAQDITLLTDRTQEVDMLGRGTVPILLGTSDFEAEERAALGLPIHIMEHGQLREGTDVRAATGYLSVFNQRPNPNATKIYVNWLLSQEGQTHFAEATRYISQRVDVPTGQALPWRAPDPTAEVISTEDERGLQARQDMQPLLEELFGAR